MAKISITIELNNPKFVSVIDKFVGKHKFLSNFFSHDMDYDGDRYSTSEHAFQAAKCVDRADKEKIINAETPTSAKEIGRNARMRPDWDQIRDSVMEDILKAKFSDEKLRNLLNETKGSELIEGNDWHDQYWGDCMCARHKNTPGKNRLGALLMKVRDTYTIVH